MSTKVLVGRYVFVRPIGKGGFGAVEEYCDAITNEHVAIKTIPAQFVNQESKRLIREVDIMCFLHDAHPHLIGYFNMFVTKTNPNGVSKAGLSVTTMTTNTAFTRALDVSGAAYASLSTDEKLIRHHEELRKMSASVAKNDEFDLHIVMPLMKGDLFYFIQLVTRESEQRTLGITHEFMSQVAVVFAFQICFGLDYLHKCDIVHRDMKPDNVLVRLDISNPYMSTALIADMGLARDAQESETFYVCTRHYRPPEIITSIGKGATSIDIWSLGCIFYEMCTGHTLFEMRSALNNSGAWDGGKASLQLEVILNTIGTPSQVDIEKYMPNGNAKLYLSRSVARPSRLEELIRQYWQLKTTEREMVKWIDLIKQCVAFFPQVRPTAEQLCRHELFRDYNVFYGDNVKQFKARPYAPTFADASNALRVENKATVLELVSRALIQTTPVIGEDDSSSEGSDDEDEEYEVESSSDEEVGNKDGSSDEISPGTCTTFSGVSLIDTDDARAARRRGMDSSLVALRGEFAGGLRNASGSIVRDKRHTEADKTQHPGVGGGSGSGSEESTGPILVESPNPSPLTVTATGVGSRAEEEMYFYHNGSGIARSSKAADSYIYQSVPGGSMIIPSRDTAANATAPRVRSPREIIEAIASQRIEVGAPETYDFEYDLHHLVPAVEPPPRHASPPPDVVPLPQAMPPLERLSSPVGMLVSPFPSAGQMAHLPQVDDDLYRRYGALTTSREDTNRAVSAILEEMHHCTHDTVRSGQLRVLLNYFMTLQSGA